MTNSPNSSSEPRSRNYEKLDPRIQRWIWESGWTELRDAQERAITPILAGDRDVIIAASTASGKTEAAFLPILTRVAEPGEEMKLVLYISPLKALINDQWQRLELLCESLEIPVTPWHGDVAASRKGKFQKRPGGCLLITPESLEAMLMRQGHGVTALLAGLCYIVIDELHSFMGSERGKQLQSQLTRIERLLQRRVCRIGLSATLGDMNGAKEFLRQKHGAEVELIEARESGQELMVLIKGVVEKNAPPDEEQEEEETPDLIAKGSIVTDLFKVLRGSNNLVFPNSRSSVEFFADRLRRRCETERVPNEFWPHHGNLSKEIREQTEAALKQKEIPASAICTSTLELGIDIGAVKSVVQIGPPPSVASLRQRLGRSGRRKGEPAILRGFAIERQLTVQSAPSDQLRASLVQSAAMVRLLTRGWYEPVPTDGLHASTMVQQALSLIAQHGGITAGKLWEMLCSAGAFSNISKELFSSLLRSLGAKELIFQDPTGLILLAPKGEQITGHYSFYAAFSSQEEYRIVTGGRTLGSMPVTRPLVPGSFVIFGGRRWQVLSVSQEDLVIEVQPGAGGALPSFEGSTGAMIHNRVREEMRLILQEGEVVPFLDKTGMTLLVEARDNYRRLGLEKVWIRQAGSEVHVYLWKGDRINDTLMLMLQAQGIVAMNHGIYLEIRKSEEVVVTDVLEEILRLPPPDSLVIAASIQNKMRQKWDPLLPEDLLNAGFASENLDVPGTLAAMKEAMSRSEQSQQT